MSVPPLSLLARLTAEATPGPWCSSEAGQSNLPNRDFSSEQARIVRASGSQFVAATTVTDAAFIAAFSPVTVAALLEVVRAAQALVWSLDGIWAFCGGTPDSTHAIHTALPMARVALAPFRAGDEA